MEKSMNLKLNKSFVCRISNKSINEYAIQENEDYNMVEFIKEKFMDKDIQIAIYLASPSLFNELKSLSLENDYYTTINANKLKSIYTSFISYINRMSNRATPFGTFASIVNGVITEDTTNIAAYSIKPKLSIEFCGNILYKITSILLKDKTILTKTKFYTNNTIQKIGKNYHYLEYNDGEKRKYNLSAINYTKDLSQLLSWCSQGKFYDEIQTYLQNRNFSSENINSIINTLIDYKILISELEPNIIGQTFHEQIHNYIQQHSTHIDKHLINAFNMIQKINAKNISIDNLEMIKEELSYLITLDSSSIFNVNCFSYKNIEISKDITYEVEKGLMHYLSFCEQKSPKEREISLWIHKFLLKFDGAFIPLKQALDPEYGIYYGTNLNTEAFDYNPLIDTLPVTHKDKHFKLEKKVDFIDEYILKETVKCIQEKKKEIELPDEFMQLNINYDALPSTFNAICKIGKTGNSNYIFYENSLTDSATTILGRFTPYNDEIRNTTNELADWEQSKLSSCIVCEFNHTTSYQDCNIMARNISREYILPYLYNTPSICGAEILDINNIYVGIHENCIVFFDMKKKKQVIPILSHSQNFNKELLPIYKFIGEVQMNNCSTIQYHARNNAYLLKLLNFQPRLKYNNYIFSLAKWIIHSKDIRGFFSLNIQHRVIKFKEYLNSRNIPLVFSIVSGDMKLYINMKVLPFKSIILIEKYITNKDSFLIEEHFYSEYQSIIKEEEKSYEGEFVFHFKNSKINYKTLNELDKRYILQAHKTNKVRVFLPNTEWIYFKIYCEYSVCEKIIAQNLIDLKNQMTNKNLVDKWHFLRYKDMQGHQLRLRFHLKNASIDNNTSIYQMIKKTLEEYTLNEIYTIKIDTYTRELERYGAEYYDLIEDIFSIDSEIHCEILSYLINEDMKRILFGLYIIKRYIEIILQNTNEKLIFIGNRINELQKDFMGNKAQRIYFNKKFHQYIKSMENYFITMKNHPIEHKFNKIENIIIKNKIPSELLPIIIHMSLNRLYKSRNRLNEYAAFSLIERYYKKILYHQQ